MTDILTEVRFYQYVYKQKITNLHRFVSTQVDSLLSQQRRTTWKRTVQ